MKNWPTDPMRQHDRFIAAFCDDLFDMVVTGTNGTPRADRVCEINRAFRELDQSTRRTRAAEKAAGHNHGA